MREVTERVCADLRKLGARMDRVASSIRFSVVVGRPCEPSQSG